jgi:hypothetical protein
MQDATLLASAMWKRHLDWLMVPVDDVLSVLW